MDAFSLLPSEMARTDAYWVGRMSATLGIAAESIDNSNPKGARRELRSVLAEFIASPVPSEELREMLRGYLERKP